MTTITLSGDIKTINVGKNKYLRLTVCNGAYDLGLIDYNSRFTQISCICENKKRLSTINKYAAKYGIMFSL